MAQRIPRTVAPEGFDSVLARREASRCLNCRNPRCVEACPAHVHIPDFIEKVLNADYDGAYDVISASSNLPSVCGRVCPHENQCEGSCVMGIKFESVAIGQIESFVADWKREHGSGAVTIPAPNGYKVAIVGSGPSGLSCARDLLGMGYSVSVFEAMHRPGGVLRYGIPEFRMPKAKTIDAEIDELVRMGLEIRTDTALGRDFSLEDLFGSGYDAVFVACGACKSKRMGIKGEDLPGVVSANVFLVSSNSLEGETSRCGEVLSTGRRCIVVGGGNVAMDAARMALRLGSQVTVVYRRSEKELPACAAEVNQAREEGVRFMMLTTPVEILPAENGRVGAVRCIRMQLAEEDSSGRRSPVPVPGSEFEIPADSVLMALGSAPMDSTVSAFKTDSRGLVEVDDNLLTSVSGVFAAGDVVTGPATVVRAMVSGRKAALSIDRYCKSK